PTARRSRRSCASPSSSRSWPSRSTSTPCSRRGRSPSNSSDTILRSTDPGGSAMTTATALKKVNVSMMNAIHDLPLLVARDEGYFTDEGLDVNILKTPGTGQRDSDHQALRDDVFALTMESLYEQGKCDQFRMCEWGIMKRAVE